MRNKAYRRHTHQVHDKRWRRIIDYGGYYPYRGYYNHIREGYEYIVDKRYISDNSRSETLTSWKKLANRKVRRTNGTFKRNDYKLVYNIWNKIF